jgi:regulator of RNase E activity RraA
MPGPSTADVIVVDGGGDTSRALIGEIMAASTRGAAGFVVDSAIRDATAIGNADFPCFARAAIHRGLYKSGTEPGEINVPVSIGGFVIEPGDIVVGDDDGVVAFSHSIAPGLLEAVRRQEEKEIPMRYAVLFALLVTIMAIEHGSNVTVSNQTRIATHAGSQ